MRWPRALVARWRASPRLQDNTAAALTFAGGVALNLLGFTGVVPESWPTHGPHWWHIGPLAVGCAGMLVKRRHPVAALLVGVVAVGADVALGGSVAILFVLFDVLFAVGMWGSPRARRSVMTALVVGVGTAVVVTALASGRARPVVSVLLNGAALFLPLWWSANIRQQREVGRVMAHRARQDAVEAERAAMARELHDAIASHLSAAAIHAGAALALPRDPERDRGALAAVRSASLAALAEMRSMIAVLRAAGDDAAVPAGLAQLDDAVATARAAGLAVAADVRVPALAPTIDQAAYRIVTEALTNARKHAPGSAVTVEVGVAGDLLSITVANTLTGPAPLPHEGLSAGTGLVSMRERALLVGGSLSAGPQEGVWRVHALLPLSEGAT